MGYGNDICWEVLDFSVLVSGGGPVHARVPIHAHPQFS